MKRYFYILTLAVCLLPLTAKASESLFRSDEAFTVAKAIKLGRESDSKLNNHTILDNPGGMADVEEGKDCDPNCASCNKSTGTCSKCSSGRYLSNNTCLVCPSNASCNGTSSYSCNSMYRKSNGQCVSNCTNVSCKSGATAKATSSGCCCELTSCPSGQRLSNGSCVSNCTGVSCKSGYVAKASSTGCCCEADTPVCGAGKVYNTTIKKCVDAVCPTGCMDSCVNGCGSCASGRYLNYNNGYCPLCSDAVPNCATCSGSSSGATCTSCESGYTLTNGECVKTECSSSSQLKIGGQCVQCYSGVNGCPSGSYRLSNGTCCAMPTGCTGFTNFDMSCTGCTSGYTLTNGRCVKDKVILDPNPGLSGCNGVSAIPTVCPSGTTRTSRGCCPAGATSSMACLQCAVHELAY